MIKGRKVSVFRRESCNSLIRKMKVSLEIFSERENTLFGTSSSGTCLLVSENADGKHSLSLLADDEQLSLETQKDIAATKEPISTTKPLYRTIVLDSRAKYIFGSSKDQKTVHVYSVPETSRGLSASHSVHAIPFEGALFALKPLSDGLNASSNSSSGIVAAVSVLGEVTLLSAFGTPPDVQQRRLEVPHVDNVVFVTTYEDNHLVVLALKKERLLFYAVRMQPGEALASVQVEVLPEVGLPSAPNGSPPLDIQAGIMGFAIQQDCAMVLYPDGYVHIIAPGENMATPQGLSFAASWCSLDSDNPRPQIRASTKLRHAMRLSHGRTADDVTRSSDWRRHPDERDGVVALGSGLFVVAYGEYVSVWDGIYCIGHSFSQAPSYLDFLFQDLSSKSTFAVSRGAVYRLRFGEIDRPIVLSLSAAIKNKGICDSIVIDVQKNVDRAPLRSQPVTVQPMQAAAESGGQTERVFRRLIDTEEKTEVKEIRALLSRDAIPSAEALISSIQPYCKNKRKIRRGESGSAKDLGLSKLPSERLAAVTVARCVFEIACLNNSFVVPLIDMLGVGVVSSEAVISVLSVADSWDMGPETGALNVMSICDPLISSDAYVNALEAVLSRVADLPERDVVKVFRFAVQCILREGSANETNSLRRWQYERLLLRSMAYRCQSSQLIQVLKKLPFSDVTACITILQEMLKKDEKHGTEKKYEVPRFVRTAQFLKKGIRKEDASMYRGLGNWVDEDYNEQRQALPIDETEICVKWISYLVDAHLSALIMDENARQMAARMLKLVRECRKESEALKSASGIISHLVDRHSVPGRNERVYKVSRHEVPVSMALE